MGKLKQPTNQSTFGKFTPRITAAESAKKTSPICNATMRESYVPPPPYRGQEKRSYLVA